MQLTENFHLNELKCNDRDNTPVPEHLIPNAIRLAKNLQIIRTFINMPMSGNSFYRTEEYNKQEGGSPKSQHLLCLAADIDPSQFNMTPEKFAQLISSLIRIGVIEQGGIGVYDTFVHYDIRGYRSRWGKLIVD